MNAALETKSLHMLSLTRAAAYLMEGLLQDHEACSSPPAKMIKWSKVWLKFRSLNNRILIIDNEQVDFEKPIIRKEGESDIQLQSRINTHNEKFSEWQTQSLVIELNDKQRDICREAIKYGLEHKKLKISLSVGSNANHTLTLLEAFGFGDEE